MSLNVTDGGDARIERVVCTIFGQSGSGKTSLAFTGEKVLLLDFDRMVAKAAHRTGKAVVNCANWTDASDITADDVKGFNTIVVDTMLASQQAILRHMRTRDRKLFRGDGQPTMSGWGALKGTFADWWARLLSFGTHVVVIAHVTEQSKGDETVERIDALGGGKALVLADSHIVGRLFVNEKGKRVISFHPTATATAKNVGLQDREFQLTDETALAEIIQTAHANINEGVKRSAKAEKQQRKFRKLLKRQVKDAKSATDLAEAINREQPEDMKFQKRALYEHAKKLGLDWDSTQGRFAAP